MIKETQVLVLRPYTLYRERKHSAQRERGRTDRKQRLGPEPRADRTGSEAPEHGAERVTGHHRREQALRLATVEQVAHCEPERE